ncbi:hypothetical protein BOW53_15880 [Solemya pervernicosa gill symbiont]|uniref:TonB-dependent receptor n=2 Tax=Gammaproteobacteria incertae sedis TaxID=118884 RepID=A0A1T2KZT1_9GAMM|nr:TonB-dependent receptor [Candidatus Reidiella endopervernicosa]OOZ38349.1 hypothetical protein BOW53_15880 [Solemya pervernicosa gill symbiont]QKQ26535.1 TonB-dependent receptor [Candidatus Reidiella endopervernicosa]
MMKKASTALLTSSLFVASSAIAAELDVDEAMLLGMFGDEELISIATGTPVAISKAPAVASVITKEDIKAMGATTLQQALEHLPGLHISSATQASIVSIRGIHTRLNPQVLILRNGQETHELLSRKPVTGQHFPLEAVERIEVIRGPGSAVYGADAFSGVINIITKDPDDIDGGEVGVRGGSFDYQDIWGQFGRVSEGGLGLAATVQYSHNDGDDGRIVDADTQTIFDTLFGTTASQAPGPLDTRYEVLSSDFTLSKGHWKSHLSTLHQRDTGQGAGVANTLDHDGYMDTDQYIFDINYHDDAWAQYWSLDLTYGIHYSQNDINLSVFPAGALLPIGADGNLDLFTPVGMVDFTDGYIGTPGRTEITNRFDLTTLYTGWDKHTWRINIGGKHEDFEARSKSNFGPGVIDGTVSPIDDTLTDTTGLSTNYMPDVDRCVLYTSIQDEWAVARDWMLTAGIRYDHYSDVGSTTNPRVSLVWNSTQALTTKLLYGSAFRAPSFSDLYAQNNPVALGNPDLASETIDTYELVFDYQPSDRFSTRLNIYYYEIEGLIELVDDDGLPGGRSTAQNARDQEAHGVEIEALWHVTNRLDLLGNVAVQRATDTVTGDRVPDAPGHQAFAGMNWRFAPNWLLNGQLHWVADRKRAAGDTRDEIDSYALTNLVLRRDNIFDHFDLGLKVNNLFDQDVREPGPTSIPNDYPQEGRSLWLELRASL